METEILSETSGKRMKQIGNIWKHDEQKICINQHGNRMISMEAYGTYEWEQMEKWKYKEQWKQKTTCWLDGGG